MLAFPGVAPTRARRTHPARSGRETPVPAGSPVPIVDREVAEGGNRSPRTRVLPGRPTTLCTGRWNPAIPTRAPPAPGTRSPRGRAFAMSIVKELGARRCPPTSPWVLSGVWARRAPCGGRRPSIFVSGHEKTQAAGRGRTLNASFSRWLSGVFPRTGHGRMCIRAARVVRVAVASVGPFAVVW